MTTTPNTHSPGTAGTPAGTAAGSPTTASADTRTNTRRRPPATAITASVLLGFIAVVGGYGAIYFTGLEGWNGIGVSFVVAYEFLSLTGLVAVITYLRGHPLGRPAVTYYAIWMIYFTLFKLIAFQELQAIPFGALATVALLLTTRTRPN